MLGTFITFVSQSIAAPMSTWKWTWSLSCLNLSLTFFPRIPLQATLDLSKHSPGL